MDDMAEEWKGQVSGAAILGRAPGERGPIGLLMPEWLDRVEKPNWLACLFRRRSATLAQRRLVKGVRLQCERVMGGRVGECHKSSAPRAGWLGALHKAGRRRPKRG